MCLCVPARHHDRRWRASRHGGRRPHLFSPNHFQRLNPGRNHVCFRLHLLQQGTHTRMESFNRLRSLPMFAQSQQNSQSDVIVLTKMQLVLVCVCREPLFSGCWRTGWVKTCSETAVEWVRQKSSARTDDPVGWIHNVSLCFWFAPHRNIWRISTSPTPKHPISGILLQAYVSNYYIFKPDLFTVFSQEGLSWF